jgi:ABC-2 type transport system ATP-binding protein
MTDPLQLSGVCKAFGRASVTAVEHVTLTVAQGSCTALMGANGSGKTTLLRLACGLVTPDSGTVRLFGRDPVVDGAARARLAAVFDGMRALHGRLTPAENAVYYARVKGCDGAAALCRFRALARRFHVGHVEHVPVRRLSRGTQQKFALAAALATGADVWLFDEPTLGLDAAGLEILHDIVRGHTAAGGAVLMATHDEAFARRLGGIVRLKGALAAPLRLQL